MNRAVPCNTVETPSFPGLSPAIVSRLASTTASASLAIATLIVTLLLGFRAGTDGLYAMVQGEDVVFVLPNALAGELTRDLLVPEVDGE